MRRLRLLLAGALLLGATVAVLPGWLRNMLFGVVHGSPHLGPATLGQIHLPPGFSIAVYAADLPRARMLRFAANGDLLVSRPSAGEVDLLQAGGDRPGGRSVLLRGLDNPHGLDIVPAGPAGEDGGTTWLYVAEETAVFRVAIAQAPGHPVRLLGKPAYLIRGLPKDGNHWTRSLVVGPPGSKDRHLFVSIGSSCNVCIEKDPRRAAILRYGLDGGEQMLYATGLRNSVGLAFQPGTGQLYATDNGRDLLGDDFPPCELNLIEQSRFYGWPCASADRVPDPDYGPQGSEADHCTAQKVAESVPPVYKFRAHNAPLGITFYPEGPPARAGAAFPAAYRGAAFVALHGSWNRSKKDGYKVVALHVKGAGRAGDITGEDFATGFMRDEVTYGRPVDVAVGPDGALYVSDDYAGQVYRIAYRPQP